MKSVIDDNALVLQQELEWLKGVIDTRLKLLWGEETIYKRTDEIAPPHFTSTTSHYASFVVENELSVPERLVLILSLAPHVRPEVLDGFFCKNKAYDRRFSEFGGLDASDHAGFLPTGETALFLLSGENLASRFVLQFLFDVDHPFVKNNILKLEAVSKNRPYLAGLLTVSQEYVDYFTTGEPRKPDFTPEFPAKLTTTSLDWEDVVLKPHTRAQIEEIRDWLQYGHVLLNGWGMKGKVKPGYRCLFYGPSGTGKTLTATLLGKLTGRDVYKVDLSLIVSKYIGETEKNLAKVFDKAENRDWILFFDEADALFGKRSETQSSHDRFANQEVAYLLQRIEDYSGLVILATNLKDNIDAAFTRRFQSIIQFPVPGVEERHQIWKKAFSEKAELDKKVNLRELAKNHEISAALIMNAVQYASIRTLKRESNVIKLEDIEGGIKKELAKDGITLIKTK